MYIVYIAIVMLAYCCVCEGHVLVTETLCKCTLIGNSTMGNNKKMRVVKRVGKMVTFTENGE